MPTLRYGIVGLGAIFQLRHRPALAQIPEVRIELVCDVNRDLAQKVAGELGCRFATDYRQVVTDDRVDAVWVLTPPLLHREVCLAAARTGKHLFCEKPLAPDLSAGREIIDAVNNNHVCLCVGENHVFDPFVQWIDQLGQDGTLGEIRRIRALQGWWGPPSARFYQSPVPCRLGAWMEDGIHMVALARHLMKQDPLRINARFCIQQPRRKVETGIVQSQVEDTGIVGLEFPSALATLEVSWTLNPGMMCLEITGTRASIINVNVGWTGAKVSAAAIKEGSDTPQPIVVPSFPARFPSQDSYLAEDRLFTQAVLQETPSPYSGPRALRDVEILLAAYQASEQNKPLELQSDQHGNF